MSPCSLISEAVLKGLEGRLSLGDSAAVTGVEIGAASGGGEPHAEQCGTHQKFFYVKGLSGSSFINKAKPTQEQIIVSQLVFI